MDKTIIVAEIGECFNGKLGIAAKLIWAARDAGCDMVKFQTLDYENISPLDPEAGWFRKIALDPGKIRWLVKYAQKVKINILFTPENIKTSQWLLDAGLSAVKIASSSLVDSELLKFINQNFKKAFLSTGMASLAEVRQAVNRLNRVSDLYILHCVSEYPTGPLLERRGLAALSPKDARLNMMRMLMEAFPDDKIGYSDHTRGILAPIAAVAMGAKVIEKHITLDRQKPVNNYLHHKQYLGTDHILSLEPDELKEMVSQIRQLELMLGKYKWERSKGEILLRDFLRGRFKGAKQRTHGSK